MTNGTLVGPAPSCDAMVALGSRTASGATLFAKNSDRPARECQPLFQAPRQDHSPADRVRCQYLEIPQVRQTWRLIGSRPAWLWGLEHGINERGVAIGNEALIAKDSLPALGLLGMDLVRLGLERASTARDAMELIGGLIERYGQGGSASHDFDWRYSNGFIIADHAEAWILESSGHQWAARRVNVDGCATISNRICTTSYDRASANVREHARAQGWWDGRSPFDFAQVYAEPGHPTSLSALGRLARSRELVARDGRRSVRDLIATLRDHYEMGEMPVITASLESERHFSLCMHTDFMCTTASMVAEIPAPDSGLSPVIWVSMAAPCTGIFIPLYAEGTVPPALTIGTMEPATNSPWWRMRQIQDRVARAPERLAPIVWRHFRPLEAELLERAETIAVEARAMLRPARAEMLSAFMTQSAGRALEATAQVEAELQI